MSFSHDGALLAAAGKEGRLTVWNVSDVERLEMLWQLDARKPPIDGFQLMYVEFSPGDHYLLSVSRDCSYTQLAIICNAKTGNICHVVRNVRGCPTWFNSSWMVTSYLQNVLDVVPRRLLIITILDVGNLQKMCTDFRVDTSQLRVDVVRASLEFHIIHPLRHCRVIHPRQHQRMLFCQLFMSTVDHFASVKIASDASGIPLHVPHRQDNVTESLQSQFDCIVPLDRHSHAEGVVVSHDESKIIATIMRQNGKIRDVRLSIYDVVTLQLLHTLPTENMAHPSRAYYLHPGITEKLVAW